MSTVPADLLWSKERSADVDPAAAQPEPPDDAGTTVRIPPLAYLRAMANLFWSCLRHPLSEATIDLSTGRVLYRS